MRQREYQFIFFLNIRHSFYSEAELGKKHSHTWELEVSMHPTENELVRFQEAEQVILNYLERFQDKYLNEMKPFDRLNPSIENYLDYIAGDIYQRMQDNGWEVKELRISENPTRTYAIDQSRMEELIEYTEVKIDHVAEELTERTVKVEKSAEAEEAAATKETVKTEEVETEEKALRPESPEQQGMTKWLIDTNELRIKTQTAGSMTRIVITVP